MQSYILEKQHEVIENPKHLRQKFIFSNSSKVLQRHHTPNEFVEIIESKKAYQSMIKEELRKLNSFDSQPDPEIEQFVLPDDPFEETKAEKMEMTGEGNERRPNKKPYRK
jgi:hypothetical protein